MVIHKISSWGAANIEDSITLTILSLMETFYYRNLLDMLREKLYL